MRLHKFPAFILAATGLGLLLSSHFAEAQALEPGKVHEKVVCRNDLGQSYALYLPSYFTAAQAWPVLFLFDPGARGAVAVGRFREAAEKFGWILTGSNNSRNGPWEPIARAAWAMWNDARNRIPFDERRIYAGGFSGGARVASLFGRIISRNLAGIIGCGAGLNAALKPEDIRPSAYFGIVGLSDFNYSEMKGLMAALDQAGIFNRLLVFEGGHAWPATEWCARAVGWMELVSVQRDLREKSAALIEEVLNIEIKEGEALEKTGRIYWAVSRYEAARNLAKGLQEIRGIDEKIERLKKSTEYVRFLKDERKRDKRETETRQRFARAVSAFEKDGAWRSEFPGLMRELKIAFLKDDLKKGQTVEDRSLASRLLFDLSFQSDSRAIEYYEKNDMARAQIFLELALEACAEGNPRESYLLINLACVSARLGDRKKALNYLEEAVDKGYSNVQAIEDAEDLAPLRETPEFRTIIERMKKSKSGGFQRSIGNSES
ncbi:MAG: hypothetical protein WCC06_09670 [Candidatus Aminicenantales bacterium]